MKPKGIILSGGPASVLEPGAPLPPASLYQAGVPILGICYGEQAMAHQLGGKVEASTASCSTACGRSAKNIRCGCARRPG